MKKYISLLLMLCVLLPMCGCVSTDNEPVEPTATATSAPTPAPTPKPVDGLKDDGKIHVYLIGECEKIETPESSWINSIAYYPECDHMVICTDNGDYAHANVSAEIWGEFKNAESKGSYYAKNFKGASEYWVTDYDGANGALIVVDDLSTNG